MSAGSELLLVEGDETERAAMRLFFEERGYVVTAVGDARAAARLLTEKFFPVALVDLDLGAAERGVSLVRFARQRSEPTAVILLTSRPSFDGAVAAMREGAIDVVMKAPDELEHLARVVAKAVAEKGGGDIHRETRAVLDAALKVMLEQARTVYDHLSAAHIPLRPRVLIVDGDQDFLKELSYLVQGKDWEIGGEMTGGGAMDKGMSGRFDVIASRDELPDLRGSMVIRTIQAQRGEVLGLLYSAADEEGRLDRMVHGQIEDTERPFDGAPHLVEAIATIAGELGTRAQERRFIQAFSADHRDFLRRYAELKLAIDRLVAD